MSRRQSYFAYLALLVGAIAFASSFARPTSGQGAATPPGEGRYRVAASGGNAPEVFVIDTVTGHTWHRPYSGSVPWQDLGIPPGAN